MLADMYTQRKHMREHLLTPSGLYLLDGSRDGRLLELVEAMRAALPLHPQPRAIRMALSRARDAAQDETLSLDDSALLYADAHSYFPRPRDAIGRHAITLYRRLIEELPGT